MTSTRVAAALAVGLCVGVGVSGVARAQFVSTGDNLSDPAQENVKATKWRGRLSTTFGYYGESADGGDGQDASPDLLLWGDLRARVEAYHIKGTGWDALGDLRLRYTPDGDYAPVTDQATARGWAGGNEYDVRELYVSRGSKKTVFSLGRIIMRDLDALTIDGFSLGVRKSNAFEYGIAAGMFPNPYSRSLDTDYRLARADTRTITGYPLATGAWAGYRGARLYGSFGGGAIFPRNVATVEQEPVRTFLTARGYARVTSVVNFFHYGVFDFTGAAGAQLTNLQLGFTWRAQPRLTLELAYSHMSTYAIETYLRDFLEDVPVPAATPVTNNLDVARMAADEGRVGANYSFLEKRVDVFGQIRYRRRDTIDTPNLGAVVAALPPDTQIDVSAGVRKKDAIKGWNLGGNGAFISGDRTTSYYLFARGNRTFLDDRLDVDVDLGYIAYQDECVPPDATCTGTSKGSTIRGGLGIVFRKSEKWLFLGDYHYSLNSATTGTMARPNITGHSAMLRGQYAF